jgi:hypothetical protein
LRSDLIFFKFYEKTFLAYCFFFFKATCQKVVKIFTKINNFFVDPPKTTNNTGAARVAKQESKTLLPNNNTMTPLQKVIKKSIRKLDPKK